MQLTLPLLRLYAEHARLSSIDYVYVGPSWLTSAQEATLAAFGIGADRILREACTADRLLAAFIVHRQLRGPGQTYRDSWGHRYVRDALAPARPPAHGARRYVRRGEVEHRRLLNEGELVELLVGRGFEVITMDGLSIAEQVAQFARADVLVAVHGAALTNLLFSRAGSSVVEIFQPHHVETSYFTAATHSQLDYHYVLGEPPRGANEHFTVDIAKVDRLLREYELA